MRTALASAIALSLGSLAACGGTSSGIETAAAPSTPSRPAAVSCTVTAVRVVFDLDANQQPGSAHNAGSTDATAVAPTHAEACAAAAAQLRAAGTPSGDLVIDGVSAIWLSAPSDGRLPTGSLDADVECEVVVAHQVGTPVSGTGSAASEAAAYALARQQACTAAGQTECSDAAGFRARVARHHQAMSFGSAGSSSTHEVTLTLVHVRLTEGRARSRASRAAACREAYRSACGSDPCPSGTSLDSLDGVAMTPPLG